MSIWVTWSSPTGHELEDVNITNNLIPMARACEVYDVIWGLKKGPVKAVTLIEPYKEAKHKLESFPIRFGNYDSPGGWGTRRQFIEILTKMINFCQSYPHATVGVE